MPVSLITGGAGFIGSHIADCLLEKNHRLIIIDNLSTGDSHNVPVGAKLYKIDIRSSQIEDIFKTEKPDFVFHLAAQTNVKASMIDPGFDAENNILGSLNIIKNSVKNGVKKLIFASSAAVYGETNILPTAEDCFANPLSPYGVGKLAVEKYLYCFNSARGMDYVSLRMSNVYGPRQNNKGEAGVVAVFSGKLFEGKQPAINGDGKQTRDYVYVKDAARAFVLAQEKPVCGTFNIGTAKEADVCEVLSKLSKAAGKSGVFVYAPAREGEQKRSCLGWHKAEKELGWRPEYDLEKGIKETVNWIKKREDFIGASQIRLEPSNHALPIS